MPPAGRNLAGRGRFLTLDTTSISACGAQSASPPPRVRAGWQAGVSGSDTPFPKLLLDFAATVMIETARRATVGGASRGQAKDRMAMDYDDEAVLTHYVWEHYQGLMTEFERRVGIAIIGRAKATSSSSPPMARMLNERWGGANDPEVEAALAEGPEAFRRRICRRLLGERGSEVLVNRCPSCGRVVRTPQARQCFWCGHDWHESRNSPAL